MDELLPGKLLIADPFLRDPNFSRSVIILCDHQLSGSFGFVLNKTHPQAVGELVNELDLTDFPVYYGGPVQQDTIHFLHQCPALIPGGLELARGIFWGGAFNEVVDLIKSKKILKHEIRFFLGYSGWSLGQLEEEMKQKSWIVGESNKNLIFKNTTDNVWKEALTQLGGEYKQMVNYPIDPQLN